VDTAAQDDAAFEDGAENPRERRQMRFYYCALAYFVSYLFYYGASLVFKENRGFGGTEKTLRDNLFTKFMQLSQEGVAGLGNGQFLDTAISRWWSSPIPVGSSRLLCGSALSSSSRTCCFSFTC